MAHSRQTINASEAQRPLFVGIDVGGTNIKIGLVDSEGKTIAYTTTPTEQDRGAEDATKRMGDAIRELVASAGCEMADVARVGLATPGPMDIPNGMLLCPGNLPAWSNTPLPKMVSESCGLPVRFANDANAAAYGEFWCGAGSSNHSMVLLTLGTGIGGGIVVGDTLVEGAHSCGAECGHILINPTDDTRRDSLGKIGSLEAYCGAYSVIARTEEAIAAGRESSLAAVQNSGEEITPLAIAQAAEQGDELAREIVFDTAKYLAFGIVTLIHTIDPDNVVLGGAMTFGGADHPLGQAFLERIRSEVKPRLLAPLQEAVSIDFATLGGDAGYLGAAGLARLAHNNS